MSKKHGFVSAVGLLIGATLSACAGDAATDVCSSDGLVVTGVTKEFALDTPRQKFKMLGGVKICVREHPEVDCVTTDADGVFELCGMPTDSEVVLEFTKKDYVPMLRLLKLKIADYPILAETVLGSNALGIKQAVSLGADLTDVSGGAIQFFGVQGLDGVLQIGMLDGFTVELTDLDGNAAKCKSKGKDVPCTPVYLGTDGNPDTSLTEATKLGVGAIGNVPEGEYLLHFSHMEFVCDVQLPESGLPSEVDTAVRVIVYDNYITAQVGMLCTPTD